MNLFPSSDLFTDVNVYFDNFNLVVNSTPDVDLSANLTEYISNDADIYYYFDETDAYDDLKMRGIAAYIVIPEGFEANITQGLPVYLNITVDGTDGQSLQDVTEIISTALHEFRMEHLFVFQYIASDIDSEFLDIISAGENWMALLIPALIGVTLIGVSMITASVSIVHERPLARMLTTPIEHHEIIISKFLSQFVFSIFQNAIFLVYWLYYLPSLTGWKQSIRGSIIDCFLILMMLSTLGLSFGLTISAIARNVRQALIFFIGVYVILLILYFMKINSYDPLTQGSFALTGIIFKGLTLAEIAEHIVILFGYTTLALIATFVIFHFRKELV
ncbi:MAG: ABC transporter permease [Candidatus Thorarchaeota archaeon]